MVLSLCLCLFSNVIFNAKIKLTTENLEAFEKNDYPNLGSLREHRLNGTVQISDLYGADVAADLKDEFFKVAECLITDIDLTDHAIHSI